MKMISYQEAIRMATFSEMEKDKNVFICGIGITSHAKAFGTTEGLEEKFGPNRCFDTPISEDAMTGFVFGSAVKGLKPIHVHIRSDFFILGMNQLANIISPFQYYVHGTVPLPIVFRVIIGRGFGQGAQHSKSLLSFFTHIPGFKVIAPSSPRDVKGLLISAIRDNNPVVFFEHRWLYWSEQKIREESYEIPIGKGTIIQKGLDITIVAISWMNVEAIFAAKILKKRNINVEIVDPRTLYPLDKKIIINSVKKTKKCLVVDCDWTLSGVSAEIAAVVSRECFNFLEKPVERLGFKHIPCPTARHLENAFYPNAENIVRAVEKIFEIKPMNLEGIEFFSNEKKFKGPL